VREPRILAVIGSGETAAAMTKLHRALFARFGRGVDVPATLIDTPYGFQENADELSERICGYFGRTVGRPLSVASYRSAAAGPVAMATAVARIRESRYVLAGPGSPSYVLRTWVGSEIPGALAAKLADGGVVTMASAAAMTLGVATIPVYEIYKVGEEPRWLEGLDLLGPITGLRAAVVPHWDNAEGGTHDTRFCYIGERRLRVLERSLPAGTFLLGIDSHTGLVLDLDEQGATVVGLGGVTVRIDGRSHVFPAGTEMAIEAIAQAARELGSSGARVDPSRAAIAPPDPGAADRSADLAALEREFAGALVRGETHAAVTALLAFESSLEGRARSGDVDPAVDAAKATFRSLIVRLGEAAAVAARDPRDAVAPFVATLLDLRTRARGAGDWVTADLLRDRLRSAGVDVRDDPDGVSWSLRSPKKETARPG
jgi:hypothetical protein